MGELPQRLLAGGLQARRRAMDVGRQGFSGPLPQRTVDGPSWRDELPVTKVMPCCADFPYCTGSEAGHLGWGEPSDDVRGGEVLSAWTPRPAPTRRRRTQDEWPWLRNQGHSNSPETSGEKPDALTT